MQLPHDLSLKVERQQRLGPDLAHVARGDERQRHRRAVGARDHVPRGYLIRERQEVLHEEPSPQVQDVEALDAVEPLLQTAQPEYRPGARRQIRLRAAQ